jgi:hypothetical protein
MEDKEKLKELEAAGKAFKEKAAASQIEMLLKAATAGHNTPAILALCIVSLLASLSIIAKAWWPDLPMEAFRSVDIIIGGTLMWIRGQRSNPNGKPDGAQGKS